MRSKWATRLSLGVVLYCLSASFAFAQQYLYRYVNSQGVKVINSTIPPEFSQKGYEVLSLSGQVVRVVPPAPSKEERARESAERELREKFAILKRRYTSVDDIESAKRRRLANINTNISILRGNIGSINIRIDNLMGKAAEMERAGRQVSAQVLQQITDAKAELSVAESALNKRLQEYENVASRFDQDAVVFVEGSKLLNESQLN